MKRTITIAATSFVLELALSSAIICPRAFAADAVGSGTESSGTLSDQKIVDNGNIDPESPRGRMADPADPIQTIPVGGATADMNMERTQPSDSTRDALKNDSTAKRLRPNPNAAGAAGMNLEQQKYPTDGSKPSAIIDKRPTHSPNRQGTAGMNLEQQAPTE